MNYLDVLRNISSHVIDYPKVVDVYGPEFPRLLREFYATVPAYNAVKVKPVLVVGSQVYKSLLAPDSQLPIRRLYDALPAASEFMPLRRLGEVGAVCGMMVVSDVFVSDYEQRNFGLARADVNSIYITQVVADVFKQRARIASTVYKLH